MMSQWRRPSSPPSPLPPGRALEEKTGWLGGRGEEGGTDLGLFPPLASTLVDRARVAANPFPKAGAGLRRLGLSAAPGGPLIPAAVRSLKLCLLRAHTAYDLCKCTKMTGSAVCRGGKAQENGGSRSHRGRGGQPGKPLKSRNELGLRELTPNSHSARDGCSPHIIFVPT